MAKGPRYRVPFRRRREGKTDYQSRRALVLSRLPRLVVRGTSKHMIMQVIEAMGIGDKMVVSTHSRELRKNYGWQGSCGNMSAAYLVGLLCGHKAVAHGVEKAVLDIGLQSPSRGSRVFAALKGFLNSGVVVPHGDDMLPDEERTSGRHVVSFASRLSSNQEAYQKMFSGYLSRGLPPEKLPEHFLSLKEKIDLSFKEEKK